MYHKILIALEGTTTDEAVLAHVTGLAAHLPAMITLLRVITVADDDGGGLGRQFQLELGSSGWRRKNQAESYLPQVARRLEQEGRCVETAVVISSRSEADTIVSFALEHACDLIAMASDARPWYARWLAGSSATAVQRRAPVPTLFINTGTRKVPVLRAAPTANPAMAHFGGAGL